jgi:hypothetical protein
VRSAAPSLGADSAGTALGRVLGLRRLGGRPTVLDDGGRRLDGVLIRRLRWSVGYGPETTAWLLRPAGGRRSQPGLLVCTVMAAYGPLAPPVLRKRFLLRYSNRCRRVDVDSASSMRLSR